MASKGVVHKLTNFKTPCGLYWPLPGIRTSGRWSGVTCESCKRSKPKRKK